MKLTFSWDDGALQDEKLFELHSKYEIPGMFFVPTKNREGRDVLTPEMIRKSESKYIKFGGHTQNHIYLTELNLNDVETEVVENKKYLEDVLGHQVDDFCLPGGKYSRGILKIIYKHYKTIRTADTMNFRSMERLLKPSIHFYPRGFKSLLGNAVRNDSYREFGFLLRHFNDDYFDVINKLIEYERTKNNRIVMIWGHSWEIEKLGLWNKLEHLMKMAKQIGCSDYSELFG